MYESTAINTSFVNCPSVDDDEDPAEVTGSADVEHLSRFAPLRRARSAIYGPKSSTGSGANLSRNEYASSATQTSLQPPSNASVRRVDQSISPAIAVDHAQNTASVAPPLPLPATPSFSLLNPTPMTNEQGMPNLRPVYSNFVAESAPIQQQIVYPGDTGTVSQYMPLMDTSMPTDVMAQPSMDDYVRTADEMSGYLTWQTMEVPPWLNFGNLFPPE